MPVCSGMLEVVIHETLIVFIQEFDHTAFLGDEGVDAAGFGVEVVSDRPLLGQSSHRNPDGPNDCAIEIPQTCGRVTETRHFIGRPL